MSDNNSSAKILVIDNYDSFTYNLVHMVAYITGIKVDVYRNDQITLPEIDAYQKIILSPGPGIPVEAGLLLPIIKQYAATKSILGVCLGHQAIAEAFGGSLVNLDEVYHGLSMPCHQVQDVASPLFANIPATFDAGRYHSWVVNKADLPKELTVTAIDDNGYIMGLQHNTLDVQGVQFHPESVLTPLGETLLRNWLKA